MSTVYNDNVVYFIVILELSLIVGLLITVLISKIYNIKLHLNYIRSAGSIIVIMFLEVLFILRLNLKLKENPYTFLGQLIKKTREHIEHKANVVDSSFIEESKQVIANLKTTRQ